MSVFRILTGEINLKISRLAYGDNIIMYIEEVNVAVKNVLKRLR